MTLVIIIESCRISRVINVSVINDRLLLIAYINKRSPHMIIFNDTTVTKVKIYFDNFMLYLQQTVLQYWSHIAGLAVFASKT